MLYYCKTSKQVTFVWVSLEKNAESVVDAFGAIKNYGTERNTFSPKSE